MKKINSIHAFLAVDGGGEGIIGTRSPDGSWMPFIAADQERLEALKPAAKEISERTGVTVKLVRFTERVELETL